MMSIRCIPFIGRQLWLVLLVGAVSAGCAHAREYNRLLRVRMQPRPGSTRISFDFLEPPQYRLHRLPGQLLLTFPHTDAPPFKKLRAYSDEHLAGVRCTQRGSDLQVALPLKGAGCGVQTLPYGTLTLAFDVGGISGGGETPPDIFPGREPILAGTEKFVREFTPPSHAALPFRPTDPKLVKSLMSEQEANTFEVAEGLLYKERGAEALEAFTPFLASKSQQVRALASYRAGEALYLMERYDGALKAFRDGELNWPEFLVGAPGVVEQYADTLARGGYYLAGRRLMGRLIAVCTGDSYVAPLINRLAEMTSRHGDREAALHLYRTVASYFPGTMAAARAEMKLADCEMFSIPRDRYRRLAAKYREIYNAPSTLTLRDEAFFKGALLDALYGTYQDAMGAAAGYEKAYPRGIFAAIVRKIREELVLIAYRDVNVSGDRAALVKLAVEHREYLARCFDEPEFAQHLAQACRDTQQLATELDLFGYLAERSFATQAAPFMMQRLVEDALALGKAQPAEASGRTFLSRFPQHPAAAGIRELLGRLAFDRGDLKQTAGYLSFLAAKGAPAPVFAESGYYLGKALLAAGDNRTADQVLSRFLAAAPGSPLACEARFGRVQTLAALGDRQGALAICREGVRTASGENADRFNYKMGELYLQLRQVREAAAAWDKVVKEGKDGVWRTMAGEALSDLQWRLKMSTALPGAMSKK